MKKSKFKKLVEGISYRVQFHWKFEKGYTVHGIEVKRLPLGVEITDSKGAYNSVTLFKAIYWFHLGFMSLGFIVMPYAVKKYQYNNGNYVLDSMITENDRLEEKCRDKYGILHSA